MIRTTKTSRYLCAIVVGVLTLPAASPMLLAQENAVGGASTPTLQFRLEEDPRNQPLLHRSLISDDKDLRAIELDVDDYELRRKQRKREERRLFEDFESLDHSPFIK